MSCNSGGGRGISGNSPPTTTAVATTTTTTTTAAASSTKRTLDQGALVFAKVKGYPHWPARVEEVRSGDKYRVLFFGTYEVGIIDVKCLFSYEEHKGRFARPNKKRFFMEALEEIERRPGMKPPVTHVMGRIGGEKKARESAAAAASTPTATTTSTPQRSGGLPTTATTPSTASSKDAMNATNSASPSSAKEAKTGHVAKRKDSAAATVAVSKDAKDSRGSSKKAALSTATTAAKGTGLSNRRLIADDTKPTTTTTTAGVTPTGSAERRRSDGPGIVKREVNKKSDQRPPQKRVSLPEPPTSPKRKRPPETSEDRSDGSASTSPTEKPVQLSRSGRTIKPKKLDGDLVEIEVRSPRKSQTPSPDLKKERRPSTVTKASLMVEEGDLVILAGKVDGKIAPAALPKGRRKHSLVPASSSITSSERADSPTTKRARCLSTASPNERKPRSPVQSAKTSGRRASTKLSGKDAKSCQDEVGSVGTAAGYAKTDDANKIGGGNDRYENNDEDVNDDEDDNNDGDDDDNNEMCTECHRRSPRKHDNQWSSQDEDEAPSKGGPAVTPMTVELKPKLSPSVRSKQAAHATSVAQGRPGQTQAQRDGRTLPKVGTAVGTAGPTSVKPTNEKETSVASAAGETGTAAVVPSGTGCATASARDESKTASGGGGGKNVAPSPDELRRQVEFLERTDKTIRANMGLERMDPDSALNAIIVLEGSFITAPALMKFPKILSTLRHVRRYPTNERLTSKADFMYNKIKNFMMTVFISEDDKRT